MFISRYLQLLILGVALTGCGTFDKDDDKKNNKDPVEEGDKNVKTKNDPPQTPQDDFNPAASQTCGTEPAGDLPDDPTSTSGIDMEEVKELFENNQLEGWVHGTAHRFGHYVFTYRGDSFFKHVELSMIPVSEAALKAFPKLNRHDKIRIGGQFARNRSPLKHLLIDQIEVIEPFEGESTSGYEYSVDLEEELKDAEVIYGKVHAATLNGAAVVLEYKDAIVPLFVREEHRSVTKNLYRNDIVKVFISTRSVPNRPIHVTTKARKTDAVTVIDHMVYCHNKPKTLTGSLVLFPESPQISFPVFALRFEDANGIVRNWTLVNFTDPDVFTAIREKLTAAWEKKEASAEVGRNHLLNKKIIVTATGMMNVVSPSQANPQILLEGPDDISIQFVE